MNKLILGDCLEVLKTIDSETVDLIYIDPPFFSNRTYEVIWGDKGEIRSFEDRFSGGIDHYIAWLKERVQEMHRILKPTGSIFVHCDWHANAEIKVFILNKIFGANNFRAEIIWQRSLGHNLAKGLDFIIDTIFWYSKTDKHTYNDIHKKFTDEELSIKFPLVEKETNRRFNHQKLEKNSNNSSKNEVRIIQGKEISTNLGWVWTQETFNKRLEENPNLIYWTETGRPRYKIYEDTYEGKKISNLWNDILPISSNSKERIGYPTQKPEALLERIIKCATNEGDTVLDCFVGGGTTVAVADKLNRNWIGIDQSVQAIKVTEFRLNKQQVLFSKPFTVQLHKYDYDTLRYKDAFEFEAWIVGQFGGLSNSKQRGDLGLDGRTRENQPIQVKRSDNIGRNVIDNFKSACERYDKTVYDKNKAENRAVGIIIAFSFGKGAIQEVARLKNEENVVIKLVTVEEIVPIAKKPVLQINIQDVGTVKDLRQIEFVATGQSEAGIEFFAWDFAYNGQSFLPTILLDKEGKQVYRFKAGEHKIAVKVVDNEGLENVEIIKLKVNGEIKRS